MTVGQCLSAGDVWLHIQTEDDEVLRSECVGRPSSGLAALRAAEVSTTEAGGGYLCTLAGHPRRCPTSFRGQYWQYWHASSLGSRWAFSSKGADDYRPAPGSIEGWCYNEREERRCELPTLTADYRPADRVDIDPPPTHSTNLWLVGGIAVVVLGASVILVRRRRDSTTA